MKSKISRYAFLVAVLSGTLAATVLAQIPVPPPPPLPGLEVRITTGRPPALRHERRLPRPDRDAVWVNGFWHWEGERWNWVSGRWEHPAASGAYWIAPRYVRSGRAYIYEPGHWSGQTVVVGEDLRGRREWRQHERDHERELQRERSHDRHHDRDDDRDREPRR